MSPCLIRGTVFTQRGEGHDTRARYPDVLLSSISCRQMPGGDNNDIPIASVVLVFSVN